MNILVVYPKPDEQKKPRFGFSYDMMIVATVLGEEHNVVIRDYSCEDFDRTSFLKDINNDKIQLAFIYCDSFSLKRSQNIINAKEIIDLLNPAIITVAFGNYCCITKKQFGNANQTITVNDINQIINCVNSIDQTQAISAIKEYDDIPHINRNLIQKIPYYNSNSKNTLLQTAKGCENTCVFCQRKGWQSCYIPHSDNYVIEEVRSIKNEGYSNVWITDENFTFNLARAKRLLKKMFDEKLIYGMKFFVSSWANIDKEFLDIASQSNVRIISFGIESGNENILNYYKKNIDIKHVPALIQYANKKGIFTVGNFIIGAPMESEKSIEDTFNLIEQCEFDQINIKNLDYMIGSSLYDTLNESLKVNDHVFACAENGLNKFPLEEIIKIKSDFQKKYYETHRKCIYDKITTFGTPF